MIEKPHHWKRPPVLVIKPGAPLYPRNLLCDNGIPPQELSIIGNPLLLKEPLVGFFSSRRLPGRLLLEAFEWAQSQKGHSMNVVCGFHSPMEKECLSVILGGRANVLLCAARGIGHFRVPLAWRSPLNEGRLTVVTAEHDNVRRSSRSLAYQRNKLVAALAKEILVAHATRGGQTELLVREILRDGKSVFTFSGPENEHLLRIGVCAWEGH